MAKYTETLYDYVERGNELPAAMTTFNASFPGMFLAHYCDSEIGFETEEIFTVKLQARAEMVLPFYKSKIINVERALDASFNPEKWHNVRRDYAEKLNTLTHGLSTTLTHGLSTTLTHGHTVTDSGSNTIGERTSNEYELPISSTTSTPTKMRVDPTSTDRNSNTQTNSGTDTTANTGTDTTANTGADTSRDAATFDTEAVTDMGLDTNDSLMIAEAVDKVVNYMQMAMKEFESLFMGVY